MHAYRKAQTHNTHKHLHAKWLTAVSIITQAAEHRGHSAICSHHFSPIPHPFSPLLTNLHGRQKANWGADFGNWGVTSESSVILIGVDFWSCCLCFRRSNWIAIVKYNSGGCDWNQSNVIATVSVIVILHNRYNRLHLLPQARHPIQQAWNPVLPTPIWSLCVLNPK